MSNKSINEVVDKALLDGEALASQVATDISKFMGEVLSNTDDEVQKSLVSLDSNLSVPTVTYSTLDNQSGTGRTDNYAETMSTSPTHYAVSNSDYTEVTVYESATGAVALFLDVADTAYDFGKRTALYGDVLLITEFNRPDAFLYSISGGTFSTIPRPAEITSYFGESVGMNSSEMVICSRGHGPYIYELTGTIRTQVALPASAGASFGAATSMTETHFIVSDVSTDIVYIFDTVGTLLNEIPRAANSIAQIALSGNRILVSAVNDGNNEGAVDVYDLEGNLLRTIHPPVRIENSYFGMRIGLSGSTGFATQMLYPEIQSYAFDVDTGAVRILEPESPSQYYAPQFGTINSTGIYIGDFGDKKTVTYLLPIQWVSAQQQGAVSAANVYTDRQIAGVSSGGIEEAPINGSEYVRKDADWAVASAAGGSGTHEEITVGTGNWDFDAFMKYSQAKVGVTFDVTIDTVGVHTYTATSADKFRNHYNFFYGGAASDVTLEFVGLSNRVDFFGDISFESVQVVGDTTSASILGVVNTNHWTSFTSCNISGIEVACNGDHFTLFTNTNAIEPTTYIAGNPWAKIVVETGTLGFAGGNLYQTTVVATTTFLVNQ